MEFFLAGVHIPKTAGSTVSSHAKRWLGKPVYYRYGRFSRTRRFFSGDPQYEELTEDAKRLIRFFIGHGVCFDVVNMQERVPEFFVILRDPVSLFTSRYFHHKREADKRLREVEFQDFVEREKTNHQCNWLAQRYGQIGDYGGEASYRNAVSILTNFKYVFVTKKIDEHARLIWDRLGIPSDMERRRVARDKEPLPITDDEILAQHPDDARLYEEAARLTAADVDAHGALNPFGYDANGYLQSVARARRSRDQMQLIENAYAELVNALYGEFKLEAAMRRMETPAPHVGFPDLLREKLARKYDRAYPRYNDRQRAKSAKNAAAADRARKRRAARAAAPARSSTMRSSARQGGS